MLIFIDETGDHDLLKIDGQYPLFGLGALVISEEEYAKMDAAVSKLKQEFFDDDGTFILHSSELKRPTGARSDRRNVVMFDAAVRARFYASFDEQVISAVDFGILACFVRKSAMKKTYSYPADPYYFSFENLLNRILRYGDPTNTMYAEMRGPELDTELRAEYERLSKTGIRFFPPESVRDRTSLTLVKKRENVNGLQVIDLALASLARSALGKEYKMSGNDLDPARIRSKYVCPPTFFPR